MPGLADCSKARSSGKLKLLTHSANLNQVGAVRDLGEVSDLGEERELGECREETEALAASNISAKGAGKEKGKSRPMIQAGGSLSLTPALLLWRAEGSLAEGSLAQVSLAQGWLEEHFLSVSKLSSSRSEPTFSRLSTTKVEETSLPLAIHVAFGLVLAAL